MTENIELERTFLASPALKLNSLARGVEMVDIYVPADPSVTHPRLRIRKQGDRYTITKKLPLRTDDASAHSEATVELTVDEFACLSKSSQRRVEKTRYTTDIGGRRAEIDVFRGQLAGLVLIDFEFQSEEQLMAFKPPAECLVDVTQEQSIAGGTLAGKSYSDISAFLMQFDYERII